MLDYAQHYAKFHPDDHAHRHGLTLFHQRLLGPLLPADRAAPILDVGCGRGYALQDIRALGYTALQGIDISPGLVGQARDAGIDATVVTDAAAHLSAHPGAYAVVLLMDVLEHFPVEAQPGLLRAIAASLRPGGRLVCMVPNASSAIAAHWRYNDYTHRCSFTRDSLEFLLQQSGFARVACSGPEFFPRPRWLFWLPTARATAWWLRCCIRLRLRATYIAELGWGRGRRVILTPNLLAVADKAG